MPAIHKIETPSKYQSLAVSFKEEEDTNACVPIAIAALTGVCPKKVNELCIEQGRVKGKGTKIEIAKSVFKALGFSLKAVPLEEFIAQYPGIHKTALKNVTSHHPRRFPLVFGGQNLFMFNESHALAVVDGVVQDWSVNRTIRLTAAYSVKGTRIEEESAPIEEVKPKNQKRVKKAKEEAAPDEAKPEKAKRVRPSRAKVKEIVEA